MRDVQYSRNFADELLHVRVALSLDMVSGVLRKFWQFLLVLLFLSPCPITARDAHREYRNRQFDQRQPVSRSSAETDNLKPSVRSSSFSKIIVQTAATAKPITDTPTTTSRSSGPAIDIHRSEVTTTIENSTSTTRAVSVTPTTSDSRVGQYNNFLPENDTAPHSQRELFERAFDASARDKLVVYWGVSPYSSIESLVSLCRNPSVNIVNLAFLTTFFGPEGYPVLFRMPGCTWSNSAQQQYAPGLPDCSALAPAIQLCKSRGIKVLLSLGGWGAATTIPSAYAAVDLADKLWSLFGAETREVPRLRPFGPKVVLDGFDFDNETHDPSHYTKLATALKALYATDKHKRKFYISAAPQCPRPDASIPLDLMRMADFVHVQFYNNPSCNLGTTGFLESARRWSQDLSEADGGGPLFIVGAPAWADGVGAGGYVEGGRLVSELSRMRALDNFGGMMLWDGTEAARWQDENGWSYLQWAKTAATVGAGMKVRPDRD